MFRFLNLVLFCKESSKNFEGNESSSFSFRLFQINMIRFFAHNDMSIMKVQQKCTRNNFFWGFLKKS